MHPKIEDFNYDFKQKYLWLLTYISRPLTAFLSVLLLGLMDLSGHSFQNIIQWRLVKKRLLFLM